MAVSGNWDPVKGVGLLSSALRFCKAGLEGDFQSRGSIRGYEVPISGEYWVLGCPGSFG